MNASERKYADKDDPKALEYLKRGRDALIMRDYQNAMRSYKKCYKSRITKELACILLDQMANCMNRLEFYDSQQEYLEELCELELNFSNVRQLMSIYMATNNEVKRTAFAEKIKKLTASDEDEEKLAITLLVQAKDHDEVISRSLDWIERHPDDTEAAKRIITTYIEQKKIEEACRFAEGLASRVGEDEICMELAALKKEIFDFEGYRDYTLRHFEIHKQNDYGVNKLVHPFMTSASYNGTLTDEEYRYWARKALEGTRPRALENELYAVNTNYFRKIRIGFVSYDFRLHSVGKFIMSMFDFISNNTGIETYCYYTYPDHEDDVTRAIMERADKFKFVGRFSDKQLRKELLDDGLDILIDLNGQTVGAKLQLLAERFAPIQIAWMGYPFSSFAHNFDYIIGDYYFDPPNGVTEKYCTESILRMDPCYMCFAMEVDFNIDEEPPQVRNGYITFGMMNNPAKYSEEVIRLWQKCLEAVPGSRLLIQLSRDRGPFVEDKFRQRLERFGLDLSRVDFGRDFGQKGYYETYNKVDVMLDTLPFGGATTTAEAIWMGVPVIGVQYHMRHGRMAFDFMSQVGLGRLCADSVDDYPQKAREVAINVELLRDLRCSLRERLKTTPLFDRAVFRNAFENAIRDVFVDYCMDNKWPFDPSAYEGKDGELLRDCVRGADIVLRELTRERGADAERLEELLLEYREISTLLAERLQSLYENDTAVLAMAAEAARLIELLDISGDAGILFAVIKTIRSVLIKFA